MTSAFSPDDRTGHDAIEVSQPKPRHGVVAGTVLHAARWSAVLSTTHLALAAGVIEAVVLSWEAGTSPLTSVPMPQIEQLEDALRAARAEHRLVADFAVAIWCDLVIQAITDGEDTDCLLADPLAGEDAFGELLAWCIADERPARYQPFTPPGRLLRAAGLPLVAAIVHILEAVGRIRIEPPRDAGRP